MFAYLNRHLQCCIYYRWKSTTGPLWLLLPKKRDNGLSHGLELLQDEEVPRLGKLHQAHPLADLIAESTAISGRGTAISAARWCKLIPSSGP
jgi:hypothetical protein